MDLEQEITKGRVTYLDNFSFDPATKTLTLYILDNSFMDSSETTIIRTATFSDVQNYQEEWDDEESKEEYNIGMYIPSFSGTVETQQGAGTDYEVVLDDVFLSFYTETTPEVKEVTAKGSRSITASYRLKVSPPKSL